MICPNSKCRKELPDNAIICPYCGTRLTQKAEPDSVPAPPKEEDAPKGNTGWAVPEPKKKKNLLVPAVIGILIVLLLISLIGMNMDGGSSAQQSTASSRSTQSTSASTADDVPASEPVSEPEPDPVVTDGVCFTDIPEGALVTVDGQIAARDVSGGEVYIPQDMLSTEASQVRVIVKNDSDYQSATMWYSGDPDSVYSVDSSSYQNSTSDGFNLPDDDFLVRFAWEYYRSFLRAIMHDSIDDLMFATSKNLDEQSYYVHSTENHKNIWDIDSASVTLDPSSVQFDNYGQRILMNVSYEAYRTNRYTNETVLNSNHRTIEMVWEDGTWKVNRIRFLSDADYNSGRYAELS